MVVSADPEAWVDAPMDDTEHPADPNPDVPPDVPHIPDEDIGSGQQQDEP
jgi:hypothetical protein